MHLPPLGTGWIEVICGPMFSGKTEELIRRLRRAQIARQNVMVFKPALDKRYHKEKIVSHSALELESTVVRSAAEVLRRTGRGVHVVGIDEVQFFGPGVVEVCKKLACRGVRVVVAGLDQDYLGRPFEPMPQLLAEAEYIDKTLAICVKCGNPAGRSQRIRHSARRVLIGAADSYEARCRRCHRPK
jgi:thymidine kinase